MAPKNEKALYPIIRRANEMEKLLASAGVQKAMQTWDKRHEEAMTRMVAILEAMIQYMSHEVVVHQKLLDVRQLKALDNCITAFMRIVTTAAYKPSLTGTGLESRVRRHLAESKHWLVVTGKKLRTPVTRLLIGTAILGALHSALYFTGHFISQPDYKFFTGTEVTKFFKTVLDAMKHGQTAVNEAIAGFLVVLKNSSSWAWETLKSLLVKVLPQETYKRLTITTPEYITSWFAGDSAMLKVYTAIAYAVSRVYGWLDGAAMGLGNILKFLPKVPTHVKGMTDGVVQGVRAGWESGFKDAPSVQEMMKKLPTTWSLLKQGNLHNMSSDAANLVTAVIVRYKEGVGIAIASITACCMFVRFVFDNKLDRQVQTLAAQPLDERILSQAPDMSRFQFEWCTSALEECLVNNDFDQCELLRAYDPWQQKSSKASVDASTPLDDARKAARDDIVKRVAASKKAAPRRQPARRAKRKA